MSSFKDSWMSRTAVAQYVEDIKANLKPGCVLTTIMCPWWLGGCYVHTAIDASSEDIEETMAHAISYSERTSISHVIIPAM